MHTHIERLFRPEVSTTRFGFFPHQVECCVQLLGRGRGLATACWSALFYCSAGESYQFLVGWAAPSRLGRSIQHRECGPYALALSVPLQEPWFPCSVDAC